MKIEICPYAGWENNILIGNNNAELVVSLEVGPRVLSYRLKDRRNIFKNYEEQMGGSGENEWKIRGGHRLWTAPEIAERTYHLDNGPVEHQENPGGEVVFAVTQERPMRLHKEIGIRLDAATSRVVVRHTIRNDGKEKVSLAPWALSVMNPGGIAIIPLPPLRPQPEVLLPERNLVLWPYTDLADPRLHLGTRFITLQQAGDSEPLKLGLAHREGWVGYLWEDCLFIKEFQFEAGAGYPDLGCNFETFTNSDMLEVETLGPLTDLAPENSVSHTEQWRLFPVDTPAELTSEEQLSQWIGTFLGQAGIEAK